VQIKINNLKRYLSVWRLLYVANSTNVISELLPKHCSLKNTLIAEYNCKTNTTNDFKSYYLKININAFNNNI